MNKHIGGAAVAVAAAILVGCSVSFPLEGRFDDGSESFRGSVNSNLAGDAHIAANSSSGASCSGQSRITYKPIYSVVVPCVGQQGIAVLQCSDGRRVRGTWTATGCTSGYGEGYDQEGRRLTFAMGMSFDEAKRRMGETTTPSTPAAGAPNAAAPVAPAATDSTPSQPAPARRIRGNATAFFVTADGYLVTNVHVLRGDRELSAVVGGREERATVIDTDAANDLALLKIEARGQPIPVAAGTAAKGEDAAALGYPVADRLGTDLKATFGKVNALSGPGNSPRFLQFDAAVLPGSSGGPLLNMRGEAIGVVTATFSTAANARRIGAMPQNVNYAVKAEYLAALLQKNIPGKWQRGSGVRFGSTAELVRQREPSVVMIVVR